MYKIRFDCQTASGIEDYESCSITLTKEQYEALPEVSVKEFDKNCAFLAMEFKEQIRNPHISFPALWISHPTWNLEQPKELESQYANSEYNWVFVCLDMGEDIWIAFKYWDATSLEEAMSSSSVSVAYPWHGDVYRLDAGCREIVSRFF